jgi:hypothetical protein
VRRQRSSDDGHGAAATLVGMTGGAAATLVVMTGVERPERSSG